MSIARRIFEVKVRVGRVLKTYHYERNSHKQAIEAASKHGHVLGARKVNHQAIFGDIEKIKLDEEPMRFHLGGGIYEDELKLDEVLGFRKKEDRRSKRGKDKEHKERKPD